MSGAQRPRSVSPGVTWQLGHILGATQPSAYQVPDAPSSLCVSLSHIFRNLHLSQPGTRRNHWLEAPRVCFAKQIIQ